MGRKPTKPGAVPNLRERKRGKTVYYFYDHGGRPRRETSLGKSYPEAIRKWADLQAQETPASEVVTFTEVANRYRQLVIPRKGLGTQKANARELDTLLRFFGDPPIPLAELRPIHVREYMDWRTRHGTTATVSANREKALLSHIWNKCREWGLTDAENPCRGITGFKEAGRDAYIEDDVFRSVWTAADEPTRDVIDLAYLTGQRPSDALAFDSRDVRDGYLHVAQRKTRTKLRIAVEGELLALLERISRRKKGYTLHHTRLVVDEDGQPLAKDQLRYRFDKARELAGVAKADFQFRDLRAKAGTDKADSSGDIRQAQAQLGHASVVMTEHYVRKGKKVTPTR
ncbi:site-specific tyrosine recombinase XerC [compost metagenome]